MWLENSKDLLSDKAVYGYRSTVLAYYAAPKYPLTAFRYLVGGSVRGRVPLKVTARLFMRSYLPPALYRQAVDRVVAVLGRK